MGIPEGILLATTLLSAGASAYQANKQSQLQKEANKKLEQQNLAEAGKAPTETKDLSNDKNNDVLDNALAKVYYSKMKNTSTKKAFGGNSSLFA